MVISSALFKYDNNKEKEVLSFLSDFTEFEVVDRYDKDCLGLYIEAETTKRLLEVSEQLTRQSFTKSFDVAYFNTELESNH